MQTVQRRIKQVFKVGDLVKVRRNGQILKVDAAEYGLDIYQLTDCYGITVFDGDLFGWWDQSDLAKPSEIELLKYKLAGGTNV